MKIILKNKGNIQEAINFMKKNKFFTEENESQKDLNNIQQSPLKELGLKLVTPINFKEEIQSINKRI